MGHEVHGHGSAGAIAGVLLLALVLLTVVGYACLAHRARRRNPERGWNRWRTAGFATGVALVAVALLPPAATWAHSDFRGHMAQHVLVGMYAPLGLVLGAPVTLLLRTIPAARGRELVAVLRSGPLRLLCHPATALVLSSGGLVLVYCTPLHAIASAHPAGHWLLNAHFLLSGCLFAHAIAGPDPGPDRPGVRVRLVYLGCAIAVHAIIAQLVYGGWTAVRAPAAEVRAGAEIMYYFGDIAELLLAASLVATWHPDRPQITSPRSPRTALRRRATTRCAPHVLRHLQRSGD
ncbi:cytochrome c oxidase assembly protein [Saccharopolyspora sp. NFXS83]|uniref:cytochrome c oxidase assembly protein n=1 Tax=Saccharopolyspora sp. NFXS83 TaxID=2993560 RepID=UPI00224AFEC2|nr:cytochrome c oxidase assembly protein [Saccharopolyspora sp. NFXS83]MCX2729263.1 cytochrome c oxidase assembly protein [Saccharopolyspora sp. NFXS83]